jgi:hypothetical protein
VENDKNARLDKREENLAARKKGNIPTPAAPSSSSSSSSAATDPKASGSSSSSSGSGGARPAAGDKGKMKLRVPISNGKPTGKGKGAAGGRKGAGFEGKTGGFLNKAKGGHKKEGKKR